MTTTESRYRRLLRAYPAPYRRRHGAEIVTTLLELAESGRTRRGEAPHLVACGLRQRFRLPAARPLAVVAAVLAAIALGAFGSAGGTCLGWQTATAMPSGAELRGLTAAIGGRNPSAVAVYPYQTAMNGPAATVRLNGRSTYSAERTRTALIAGGWRVTTFSEQGGRTGSDLTTPVRAVGFAATRDGVTVRGYLWTTVREADDLYGWTDEMLEVWPDEPAAARPLTIGGLLAGAVAGWLLTAALAARSRRATVGALGATALAAAAVPAFVLYCGLYQVLTYDSGAGPHIEYGAADRFPAGLVMVCAAVSLLACAAAAVTAVRGARTGAGRTLAEPMTSS